MGRQVGVDEAGRGPVLGSMFVAAVAVPNTDVLPIGIRDSKQLTDTRRESLAERLQAADDVDLAVHEVTAETIDRHAGSLNQLTSRAYGDVIRSVVDGARANGIRCLVDACDVDAERFGRWVTASAPNGVTIEAAHGADETHAIVGAASIIAKSRRERHVARLAEAYGEIGSGYPSDPTTRSFLEAWVAEHGSLPGCARRSWQTSRDLRSAGRQVTWEGE